MNDFFKDVDEGLKSNPKYISSKYFYDEKGDDLFVEIMKLPEYYLTKSEIEIFKESSEKVISKLSISKDQKFELIELGAGDGTKTYLFIAALIKEGYNFNYVPIDISKNALTGLSETFNRRFTRLSIEPIHGDYFSVLKDLKKRKIPKVLMFLGSNLGNLDDQLASNFLKQLSSTLDYGNSLILGLDMKKDGSIVLPAYNDSKGITKKFNLNVLDRINRELEGNFNVEFFDHQPVYDELEGIAYSYLVSLKNQKVMLRGKEEYRFTKGEKILTEISRKYDDDILNKILINTSFRIVSKITDKKEFFADYILTIAK